MNTIFFSKRENWSEKAMGVPGWLVLDQKVWRRRWNERQEGKRLERVWRTDRKQWDLLKASICWCEEQPEVSHHHEIMGTTRSLVAVIVHSCVRLTGLREMARWLANNILGCVCEGVSGRHENWVKRLSKEDGPPQFGWASPNSSRARVEHNSGEREDFLCLS